MMLTTRTSQWIAQDRYALFSFLIILIYLAMALFSAMGWVASDFSITDLDLSYQSPSWKHWLGTDFLGRDVFSRAIHGSQIALQIGFFSASLATLIGLTLGSLGGFYGGRVDAFVVWVYTTFSSIPSILLLSAFAFVLGQGLENLYIALGLTSWVKLCRLVRAEFLKNKSLGLCASRQGFRGHILFSNV
jgi:ABC-type dipeptide/oligopeptide/nickel transport system permease subunit